MASVGPPPTIAHHNNGAQDNNFSEAEQDCKISSSNHRAANPLLSLHSSSSTGHNNSTVRNNIDPSNSDEFLEGASSENNSPDTGLSEPSVDSGGGGGVGGGTTTTTTSAPGQQQHPEASMFNSADQGSRNSNNFNNTSDSSISSSTNNFSVVGGAGESDLDASGESSSNNYRAPCVAEDDAGSSSHSEVRSSSPGLADADADVEDSPSGSEETGSESERGSTPNMYAPNTVGFPPSRSSLTHCIPAPGSFGSTVKFAAGNNPFAVKGLPAGSISSSSSSNSPGTAPSSSDHRGHIGSQNSNNSFSASSRAGAGRWGSCQSQPQPLRVAASVNTRPIIRPSALGSSLGGSGVTSSTPTGSSLGPSSSGVFGGSAHHSLPNFYDMSGADSSDQTLENTTTTTTTTSSVFVLRPPKLPFGLATSSSSSSSTSAAKAETGFSAATPVFGSATGDMAAASTSSEINKKNEEELPHELSSTSRSADGGKEEGGKSIAEPAMVFVPLAKEETHPDGVSTTGHHSSGGLFHSTAPGTSGTAASTSSSSFSAVSQSDSAFVFGSNLHDRVSNVGKEGEEAPSPSANGISSSSASDGLFSAALRNVQSSSQASPSSSSSSHEPAGTSSKSTEPQPSTSAFGDMSESSHADRKRRFEEGPVITGEEDEFNVLQMTCRLFGFDSLTSTWLERGRGQLRLNDRGEANNELHSRLIVRTKGSLRLMLNTNVWSGMRVDRTSNKSVRFSANDNGQLRLFLVMATVGEVEQFFKALDWRIKKLKAYEDQHGLCSSQSNSEATSSGNACSTTTTTTAEAPPRKSSLIDQGPDSAFNKSNSDEDDESSASEDEDEDEGHVDDDELHDSPTKKKRLIDHNSPTNTRVVVSSPPEADTSKEAAAAAASSSSSNNSLGFRPIPPTILINNHDMNDVDEDGACLD